MMNFDISAESRVGSAEFSDSRPAQAVRGNVQHRQAGPRRSQNKYRRVLTGPDYRFPMPSTRIPLKIGKSSKFTTFNFHTLA